MSKDLSRVPLPEDLRPALARLRMDPNFDLILRAFPIRRIPHFKPGDDMENVKYLLMERQGQLDVLNYLGLNDD